MGRDHFRITCGLPVSTYFSAVKLKWMMTHVPGVQVGMWRGRAGDQWLLCI